MISSRTPSCTAALPTKTAMTIPIYADTYPRLVGDIGGTNARFALVSAAQREPEAIDVLRCAQYPSLRDAVDDYLHRNGLVAQPPRWAALGMACPVSGDALRMTNNHWALSVSRLREELALDRLLLLNDFTALALGVPALGERDVMQVGGGAPQRPGAMAVLGPGTGLGVSGLLPVGGDYLPIIGEGGHVTLPACTPEEAALAAWCTRRFGHASAERLISGGGLALLHEGLAHVRGHDAAPLTAAAITSRALQGQDALCSDAVSTFCAMLGTIASNLALTLGAFGGVYIGGGIVPKLGPLFAGSPFRQRFEDKGRFASYLAKIPVYVIEAPHCALHGAARALEASRLSGVIDLRTYPPIGRPCAGVE
jgi:glucokinase